MKKIYLQPTIEMLGAETEEMIAASLVQDGFDATKAPELDETVTSGNLSRVNVWGDDEE
jgi:hypothetical protein